MRRLPLLFAALVASLLAALLAALAAEGAGGSYWLGPSFQGLPLTHTSGGALPNYTYGDCTPEGDGGCAAPVQVQNSTTCAHNPLAVDALPSRLFRIRGGSIAAVYPDNDAVDVGTGRRTVTVFAEEDRLALAAARQLRPRGADSPPRRLPLPVYPRAVLAEIVRVVAAGRRLHSVKRIGREAGLSAAAVRVRLRMAAMLGRRALRGVRAPKRPWGAVKHDRQVALWVEEFGEREAARRFRLTRAQLRRTVRRVRGLTGAC